MSSIGEIAAGERQGYSQDAQSQVKKVAERQNATAVCFTHVCLRLVFTCWKDSIILLSRANMNELTGNKQCIRRSAKYPRLFKQGDLKSKSGCSWACYECDHLRCRLASRIIVAEDKKGHLNARRRKAFITGKTCTAARDFVSFKTIWLPRDVFYHCDRFKRFVPRINTFLLFSRVNLSRGRIPPSTVW